MKIEIERRDANDYYVRVDDWFADRLGVDEALGVVASALFRTTGRPLFVRSYEEWAADPWRRLDQPNIRGFLPKPGEIE